MRVAVLRRYPVKSMLGERLTKAEVTATGLIGDRALGLIDRDTGKVVSAKNPRLWRAMLTLTATGHPEITVTFPDGTTLPAEAAGQALSQLLGRPVAVAATPPPEATLDRSRPEQVLRQGITAITAMDAITLPGTTFHDFAAIHLITTSALTAIGTELERYRPNIVIETADEGFPENDWLDRELRIGPDVRLRVIARTPRCAVPTLEHGALGRDVNALRIPAKLNRVVPIDDMSVEPCAGIYADVVRPGAIRVGDVVTI